MPRTHAAKLVSSSIDQACIALALGAAGLWSTVLRPTATGGSEPAWAAIAAHHAVFAIGWYLASVRFGLYQVPVLRNRRQALRVLLEAWIVTWGVAGLVAYTALPPQPVDLWLALVFGLGGMATVRMLLSGTALAAGPGRPRTLVLGACPMARALSMGQGAKSSMDLLGFVPFRGEDPAEMPHLRSLGSFEDLREIVRQERPELVLIAPADSVCAADVGVVFRTCDRLGIGIHYFPSFLQVDRMEVGMAWTADLLGLALRTPYNRSPSRIAKRAIDFLGAAMGIALLLPVFLVCMLAVRLTSRGPIFYRQTRVGQNGEPFTCFKFRTMRVGAHADREKLRAASIQDGPAFKIPNDPRITPVGRLLRKFSLDELPQLFNVLIGDMSLVGPRPPIPSEVEQYAWWQRRRIMVKPGLTCIWQVWGRNRVSFKRWVEMDIYYIDNWSLWMDIKLILHTVRVVLRGTGM